VPPGRIALNVYQQQAAGLALDARASVAELDGATAPACEIAFRVDAVVRPAWPADTALREEWERGVCGLLLGRVVERGSVWPMRVAVRGVEYFPLLRAAAVRAARAPARVALESRVAFAP
jgi:hypothetical protein